MTDVGDHDQDELPESHKLVDIIREEKLERDDGGESSTSHPQSKVSDSNLGDLNEVKNAGGVEPPKPDAWMSYNNTGGAGLQPYLLRSRAESHTNLANGEGPPAYDTDKWPQPLYSQSTIKKVINKLREKEESLSLKEGSEKSRYNVLDKLEESFKHKNAEEAESQNKY